MPHTQASPRAPRYDADAALAHLTRVDPKLGRLIAKTPFTLKISSTLSPFESLVESIVYQQLHGKAAATIHRRLLESFHPIVGLDVHFSPEHILD
jgi:DNA-3-methyladenine glycosylase II